MRASTRWMEYSCSAWRGHGFTDARVDCTALTQLDRRSAQVDRVEGHGTDGSSHLEHAAALHAHSMDAAMTEAATGKAAKAAKASVKAAGAGAPSAAQRTLAKEHKARLRVRQREREAARLHALIASALSPSITPPPCARLPTGICGPQHRINGANGTLFNPSAG